MAVPGADDDAPDLASDAARDNYDVSSLELVCHIAAACPPWLKEKWIEWLGPDRLWEVYSGTEAIGATVIGGREWLEHRGSVGRLAPGASVRILDEAGNDVTPGEVGEIYFRPPGGLGSTYHYLGAQPRASGEWETFGDLGRLDAEGYLYLADRRTDLIISGGANIYPAEIEAAIDAFPGVLASVAIGLPDEDLGQRVHAIVEVRRDAAVRPRSAARFPGAATGDLQAAAELRNDVRALARRFRQSPAQRAARSANQAVTTSFPSARRAATSAIARPPSASGKLAETYG